MKVDVILISYNQEQYIAQAVESVLMQHVGDDVQIRVIIADDCSTDDTLKVIQSFEKKSPFPFIYLKDRINLGIADNYRRAFKNIDADYFAILEGDDYWIDSYKLQKQLDYLESNLDVGICSTDCLIEIDGIRSEKGVIESTNYQINQSNPLFENQYLANLTWLIRKNILQYINIPKDCVDIPLLLLYEACLHSKIEYLDDVTGVFRRHFGSVTNNNYLSYRKYYYDNNLFRLRLSYSDKFSDVENNKRRLFSDALVNLYPLARMHNDMNTCQCIKRYFCDKLDFEIYDSFADSEIVKYKSMQSLRQSKAYRIGKLIMIPFSLIRDNFNR